MRRLLATCVVAGVAFSTPVKAQTTDPGIAFVGNKGVPEAVTVYTSSVQDTPNTYVAFVVTLYNGAGSELRNIRTSGSTGTSPSSGNFYLNAATATIREIVAPTDASGNPLDLPACLVDSSTRTSFSCDFSNLSDGTTPFALASKSLLTFTVIVNTPVAVGTIPSADPIGRVVLNLSALVREGKSSTASSSSDGLVTAAMSSDVTKLSVSSVTSLVLKNTEGRFFTGRNGVTSTDGSDEYTTKIVVPASTAVKNLTTLKVLESSVSPTTDLDCRNGRNFRTCYQSQIDITYPDGTGGFSVLKLPDGAYMEFELRVGPTNIFNGLQTDKVRVTYDGVNIGACQVTSQTEAPVKYATLPCISSITYYKNRQVSGWTQELDGVLQVKITNDKNGLAKLF